MVRRPEMRFGPAKNGESGSSSRAFKLSRIHVDKVIASARERRFHAASSFGNARKRTTTDLTGGLGICSHDCSHSDRPTVKPGSRRGDQLAAGVDSR